MNNVNNDAKDASAVNGSQNVNLVQSIIRFDCNGYNEKEDADYQPDPEVEEEIIQEYQNEAEQLQADEVYHGFVETINVDVSRNVDNLEDENDDSAFIVEEDLEENNQHENQQEGAEENFVDCDSSAYDSTCTETDLEDENVKAQIGAEELKLLIQQVPVKVPKSSLHASQTTYPPFWRLKHALQNVDSEKEADPETDPDYMPTSTNEEESEVDTRDLQLRHRIVQVNRVVSSDASDTSSASEAEDDEDDTDLAEEMKNLKELENLSQQVTGMVEMVEEMSFVDGEHDNETEKGTHVLGNSNYFQRRNVIQSSSIVDAIAKFDDQTYQEDEDADYIPIENKENEICMQE